MIHDLGTEELRRTYNEANGYFAQVTIWFSQLSRYLAPEKIAEFGYYDGQGNRAGTASRLAVIKKLASKEGVLAARRIADAIRDDVVKPGQRFFEVELDDTFPKKMQKAAAEYLAAQGVDPLQPEYQAMVNELLTEWQAKHYEYRQIISKTIHDMLVRNGGFEVDVSDIIHNLVIFGNAAFKIMYKEKQRAVRVKSVPLSAIRIPKWEGVTETPLLFEIIHEQPQNLKRMFSWLGKEVMDDIEKNIDDTNRESAQKYIMVQHRMDYDIDDAEKDTVKYALYQGEDFTKLLAEWEMSTEILHFARGMPVAGHAYGEGLGALIVGDAQVSDLIKRDMLKAASWKSQPAFLMSKDLKRYRSLIRPGAVLTAPDTMFGSQRQDAVRAIDLGGDIGVALAALQKIDADIKVASAYQPGTQDAPTNVTLGQWESHEAVDVKTRSLMENIIELRVLKKVIETVYEILRERQQLKAATALVTDTEVPPLNQGEIVLRFTGYDEAVNKRRNVQRLGEMIMLALQYENSPQMQAYMPREKFYPYTQRQLGISADVINTPAEAKQYMQMLQQQMKQQAQDQQAAGNK